MSAKPHKFDMFAPTSAEVAAKQSNPKREIEVMTDVLKPDVPKLAWAEGDNWVRFINTWGNDWFQDVTYYEMRLGNKAARVAHQDDLFGEINLLRAVQIGLYANPETRPAMKDKTNPKGFQFREHRKAYLVAAVYFKRVWRDCGDTRQEDFQEGRQVSRGLG